MARIKIDQFNDYYNAELIGVFTKEVAIVGGGDTEEEAKQRLEELKNEN